MLRRRPATRRSADSGSKGSGARGFLLFLLGVLVGGAGFYFGCRHSGDESRLESATSPKVAARAVSPRHRASRQGHSDPASIHPSAAGAAKPSGDDPGPVEGVRVAIVIDDLGRSVEDVETLARLGVAMTYAVLPFETATPEVIAALHRHGAEVLCHLPMEAKNGADPGPGALRFGMDQDEIKQATAAALAAVPGAVGVNNHMGSRLSADERSMRAILAVLASRRLFFLDSRTSPESVGYRLATSLGVPAAERQVFLDGDLRPEMIRQQFARMLQVARTRGSVIAIGHPHPATLETLAVEVPRALAEGYRFVPVSDLLDRPSAAR
ncbi:MAG TPA: divergent polysaccharide deacetylase family protein [Thermoanaerobaculia bacterium]|nr:divergent polysaccharide deacetylase family protein [Thermoanaerobaculia bacterium]